MPHLLGSCPCRVLQSKTCPSSPLSSFPFFILPKWRPQWKLCFFSPCSLAFQWPPPPPALLPPLPHAAYGAGAKAGERHGRLVLPTAVNLAVLNGTAVYSWLRHSLLPPLQDPGGFTVPATSQQSLGYCIFAADCCPCQQS